MKTRKSLFALAGISLLSLTACGSSANVLPWGGKKKVVADFADTVANSLLDTFGGDLNKFGVDIKGSLGVDFKLVQEYEEYNREYDGFDVDYSNSTFDGNLQFNNFSLKYAVENPYYTMDNTEDVKLALNLKTDLKYDYQYFVNTDLLYDSGKDNLKGAKANFYVYNSDFYLDASNEKLEKIGLKISNTTEHEYPFPLGEKCVWNPDWGTDEAYFAPFLDVDGEEGETLSDVISYYFDNLTEQVEEGLMEQFDAFSYNENKYGFKVVFGKEMSSNVTDFLAEAIIDASDDDILECEGVDDTFRFVITVLFDKGHLTKIGVSLFLDFSIYLEDAYSYSKYDMSLDGKFHTDLVFNFKYDDQVKVNLPSDLDDYNYMPWLTTID